MPIDVNRFGNDNMVMDIYEIRRQNLQYLADKNYPGHGQQAALAERMGWKRPRASQLLNPNNVKNMGGTAARLVEKEFSLPRGWMDEPHTALWSGEESHGIAEGTPTYVSGSQSIPLLNETDVVPWVEGKLFGTHIEIQFPILPMMELSSQAYVLEETTNSMPPMEPGDFYYVDPKQEPKPGDWCAFMVNGEIMVGIYEKGRSGSFLKFNNPNDPDVSLKDATSLGKVLTRMNGDFLRSQQ